ncbi:lantibiotic dehydratase [Streptosporangium sp. NPDC006930]|uniref:lantibiotic dehydratase n=1 Tax=unclassified Streptosporangium TaxID=2632669 RepID=UPI0034366340
MSRTAQPADRDYVVAPTFAIRVAGLPADGLRQLRCERTWRLVDELLEVARTLADEGRAMSGPLHEVIGAGVFKPVLVALRRDLFRGRRPDRRATEPEVLAALPEELRVRVLAWIALKDLHDRLAADLPAVYETEQREKAELLRVLAEDATFRRGLELGSPILAARTSPSRQEAVKLARYLARATMKTSPYATFAWSGFGTWTDDGPMSAPPADLTWREVVDLDRAVLRPLWMTLSRHAEAAETRVNPTAFEEDGRIWFLGPTATEPLLSVPATEPVKAALAEPARALADIGLVELVPPYGEHDDDPLTKLGVEQDAKVIRDLLTPREIPERNLFWHNAVIPGDAGRCGREAWCPALDDLNRLRKGLALFDGDLPVKLAAADFFLLRYGPGAAVPVMSFYRAVHSDPGPLRDLVRDVFAAGPGHADLRERFLRTGEPPDDDRFRAPGSICVYAQALPEGRLVVNTVTAGYGKGLSRLHHQLRRIGHAPDVSALRAPQRDIRIAEVTGALGSGLNLRTPTADVTIDYPYTTGGGLHPSALTVRLDGSRLALWADGEKLRPMHLGMTAQHWLPPWLQFLVRVFGEPSVAMVPGWVLRPGPVPPRGRIDHLPRLDLGMVTLARECWRLRAADFPSGGLPALASWLRDHGMPRRFFARVLDLRDGLLAGLLGKHRKPMYVDVTDPFLLAGLRHAAGNPDALMVVEEALPVPEDAPVYPGGPRVTEYVIQLSAP